MPAQWNDSGRSAVTHRVYNSTTSAYHCYIVWTQNTQVGDPDRKGATEMNCSIEGCPGEYEHRETLHTVRYRGQVVVIDYVPAEAR